ncbi:MAG TPA: hypothetical protein VJ957_01125 [Longimicrobiales bacterium]|nr:hypothetical protein [Longimicrobiales bacterium]
MGRIARLATPTILLALAACDTGTQPRLEPGNVDAYLGATVVQGDTVVTVNGTVQMRHPSVDRALWWTASSTTTSAGSPRSTTGKTPVRRTPGC